MKLTFTIIKNSQWHEPIRLFSGRLKTIDRFNFIINLSDLDILLASRCISVSAIKEKELTEIVAQKALSNALNFSKVKNEQLGFLALLELNRIDLIIQVLKEIDANYDKSFRIRIFEIIPTIFEKIEFDQLVTLIDSLFDVEFNNFSLIEFLIKFLKQKNFAYSETIEKSLNQMANQLYKKELFNLFLLLIESVDLQIQSKKIYTAILNQDLRKIHFTLIVSIIEKYSLTNDNGFNDFIKKINELPKSANPIKRALYKRFNIKEFSPNRLNNFIAFSNGTRIPILQTGDLVNAKIINQVKNKLYVKIKGIPLTIKCIVILTFNKHGGIPIKLEPKFKGIRGATNIVARIDRIDINKNKITLSFLRWSGGV